MSGTNTGRPPHSDPEWARSMEQRVRALEQSSTKRIGDWTILQREDRLLAMNNQDGDTVALDGQILIEDALAPAGRGFVVRSELINDLTGQETTLGGRGGLAAVVADLRALLGHPAGLGTGYPSAERAGGNIVGFISDLIDKIFSGAQGDNTPNIPRTAADVGNALSGHRLSILSNTAIAEAVALAIANAAFSTPAYHAVDPTLNATFNLTTISGSTPTTIDVKQAASVIGYIRIPTATRKATVAWQGYGTVNIDRIRLNIYKVDTGNGVNTPIGTVDALPYVSNVLLGGGQIPWVYVPIDAIDVAQGECYGAEIAVEGSGTHTMVGLPDHWLGPNPLVYPSQLAATRTAVPPIFEALGGTGLHIAVNTTNPGGSWTHDAAEDSTVVVVVTTHITTASYTAFDRTVEYDGIGMQSLGAIDHSDGTNGWTEYFILERAPLVVGPATIALSISGSGTFRDVAAQSISYQNVGSVGPLQTQFASTVSLISGAFASDPTHLVLQSFAGVSVIGASYAMTRTDGSTDRYADTVDNGTNSLAVILGEKTGATTVNFTATANKGSPWSSAGVALAGVVPPAEVLSPTYSPHVPWIALSSETEGSRGTYAPERTPFLIHNVDNYTPPTWATHLDFVAVGAGGSGEGEVGFNMGQGGDAGAWFGVTLLAGDDFIPGETVFTVIPGEGGHAIIGYFSNGNDGEPTEITWTDPLGVDRAIMVAGGEGGHLGSLFGYNGESAGNFVFNGETYYGGRVAAAGTGGHEPGGGGGGAVIFQPFSGAGADGAAWAIARQVGVWLPPATTEAVFPFTFPSHFA